MGDVGVGVPVVADVESSIDLKPIGYSGRNW